MIIILCDSWSKAESAYKFFLEFVKDFYPSYTITDTNDHLLKVSMINDVKYMF